MSSQWLNGEDVFADLDEVNQFYVKPYAEKKKDITFFFVDKSKKVLSPTGSRGRGRNIESDSDEEQPQGCSGRGSSLYGRRSPLRINIDAENEIKANLRRACGDGYSNYLDEEYWLKKQGNTSDNPLNITNRKTTFSYKPKSLHSNTKSNQLSNSVIEDHKIINSNDKEFPLNINAMEFTPLQCKDRLLKKNVNEDLYPLHSKTQIEREEISKFTNQIEPNIDVDTIADSKILLDKFVSNDSLDDSLEDKYNVKMSSKKSPKIKNFKRKGHDITNEINFLSRKDFSNHDTILLPDISKTSPSLIKNSTLSADSMEFVPKVFNNSLNMKKKNYEVDFPTI